MTSDRLTDLMIYPSPTRSPHVVGTPAGDHTGIQLRRYGVVYCTPHIVDQANYLCYRVPSL